MERNKGGKPEKTNSKPPLNNIDQLLNGSQRAKSKSISRSLVISDS